MYLQCKSCITHINESTGNETGELFLAQTCDDKVGPLTFVFPGEQGKVSFGNGKLRHFSHFYRAVLMGWLGTRYIFDKSLRERGDSAMDKKKQ